MNHEPATTAAQLAVDPISAASPDMSDADFSALRESIRTQGQLVPIVMHDGQVIDGRKRLAACVALNLTPVTIELGAEADPETAATALNLLRTHYTTSQRAMFVSRLATIRRGTVSGTRPRSPNSDISIPEAASLGGVAPSAVSEAKRLRSEADPKVIRAVERGDLTLHAAGRIVASVPRDAQASTVERVVASRTPGKRNTSTAAVLGVDVRKGRAMPPKPAVEALSRLFRQLTDSMEVLKQYSDAPLPDWDTRRIWVRQLGDAMHELRRYKRRLEEER